MQNLRLPGAIRSDKDLRTNTEIGNVDRVLDGDIDEFIKACLFLRKNEDQSNLNYS